MTSLAEQGAKPAGHETINDSKAGIQQRDPGHAIDIASKCYLCPGMRENKSCIKARYADIAQIEKQIRGGNTQYMGLVKTELSLSMNLWAQML